IEQDNAYRILNPDTNATTATIPPLNDPIAGPIYIMKMPMYRCPSDGTGLDTNSLLGGWGRSNYVVNREVFGPDASNNPSFMTVATIPDGSSNTILVGERDSVRNIAAVWPVRSNVTTASFEGRPGRGLNIPYPGSPPPPTTTSACERLGFTSLHTGGVNFLLGDGHVQFIRNAIPADQSADHCAFPAASGNFTCQNLIPPTDGNPINAFCPAAGRDRTGAGHAARPGRLPPSARAHSHDENHLVSPGRRGGRCRRLDRPCRLRLDPAHGV